MKSVLRVSCLTAAALSLLCACSKSPKEAVASEWGFFNQYCTDCHNDLDLTGGLSLESKSPSDVTKDPALFEHVIRKLRGSLMPPPGGPHPPTEKVHAFVSALEADIDNAAEKKGPMPGHVAIHRLSRTEYADSVEDLLGVKIDAEKLLPADAVSDGFDNVADVLRVSPTYLDQYIEAAREVSMKAVGNAGSELTRAEYLPSADDYTRHIDGLPLGTRGGVLADHYFPADGDYVFTLKVSSELGAELRAYPQGWLPYRTKVVLTIDDAKVFEGELGGADDLRAVDQKLISAVNAIKDRFRNIRVPVKAGYHRVGATFVARSHAESDYELESMIPGEGIPDVPQMLGMEIVGPYKPTGVSEPTESRRRIFICHPETEKDEPDCARRILTHLATLAFRRPVTDADMAKLLKFYERGRQIGGFETGIQKGIMAILASTDFLYRVESEDVPSGVKPGQPYKLTDLELASRLAFLLWSEGPDAELLSLAEQGRLSDPNVYDKQIDRMFADPRSKSLVANFAFQWLGLRNLDTVDPDPALFPNFDKDLRRAFVREMDLFLDSILRDKNKSVVDLLTADYTFVNERLARHYGISGIRGDRFRRVKLADPRRWGLLGKGAVLMATLYPDRTSPVLRGQWIMDHLLGTPPESPPKGVNTTLPDSTLENPKSVRERLALHRSNPSCNHCHGVMDPLGQALENFNAIGEWRVRERDTGVPVDPTGELANGTKVTGPIDLRNALTANPQQYVQTIVQKLMTFALGRDVEYYDMPTVRAIVRDSARSNYSFLSILKDVANSPAFRMRSQPKPQDGETVASAGSGKPPSGEAAGED